MRRTFALALMAIPAALAGQEGVIVFDYAREYEFEVPERLKEMGIPSAVNMSMVLLFNGSESVMLPVPEEEGEEGRAAPSERNRRAEAVMTRLKMRSASRADQETALQTYTSFADDAVVESREFMGRGFLISGSRPRYEWKLAGEQREFMGYLVQKATAEHDGSTIEAWFTPQIPVQAGPGPYGGLPGMILVLTVDAGKAVYSATQIELEGRDVQIAAPTEGDMVTREEYERIVAEKLEELRSLRGDRGDRRRPFR